MKSRIKRVKCRSGLTGWQCRLLDNYKSYEEWEQNADLWGLHFKLGYKTPQNAWRANPVVQGSTNPGDYCKIVAGRRMFQRAR